MSSYREGQTHQLVEAMEAAGFTAAHLTRMGQSQGLLRNFIGVLNGTHEIRAIEQSHQIVQPPAQKRVRPPKGARIHTIRVRTKLDSEWQAAINDAGPNTPDHYNVRKVGDQYAPTGAGEVESDLVLLNYPNGDGSLDKARAWARSMKLHDTDPREVFSVGGQRPQLHRELMCGPMYVVATTECAFEGGHCACYVWWDGSKREASLGWVSGFGLSFGWFAFRK